MFILFKLDNCLATRPRLLFRVMSLVPTSKAIAKNKVLLFSYTGRLDKDFSGIKTFEAALHNT